MPEALPLSPTDNLEPGRPAAGVLGSCIAVLVAVSWFWTEGCPAHFRVLSGGCICLCCLPAGWTLASKLQIWPHLCCENAAHCCAVHAGAWHPRRSALACQLLSDADRLPLLELTAVAVQTQGSSSAAWQGRSRQTASGQTSVQPLGQPRGLPCMHALLVQVSRIPQTGCMSSAWWTFPSPEPYSRSCRCWAIGCCSGHARDRTADGVHIVVHCLRLLLCATDIPCRPQQLCWQKSTLCAPSTVQSLVTPGRRRWERNPLLLLPLSRLHCMDSMQMFPPSPQRQLHSQLQSLTPTCCERRRAGPQLRLRLPRRGVRDHQGRLPGLSNIVSGLMLSPAAQHWGARGCTRTSHPAV